MKLPTMRHINLAQHLSTLNSKPWFLGRLDMEHTIVEAERYDMYAEPSIRPDDSRYGENPNRLQRHTQFQVILKPDPGNSQDLFIRCLSALGCIDVNKHDIRFVEDNWESPVSPSFLLCFVHSTSTLTFESQQIDFPT
ncbi:hypothetical protein LXL04_027109 [Taraxacum kok-saghyz]